MRPFPLGYVMGILVSEGGFTGTGTVPVSSVKRRARDPVPLQALRELLGGLTLGPYRHGGRHYFAYRLAGAELRRAIPLFDVYLPPSYRREQYDGWRRRYFAGVPIAVAGDAVLNDFGC